MKKGKKVQSLFLDINGLTNFSKKERTGYPTQKPLALLERIIKASCPKDGIILDPFCGCATTCVATEKLNKIGNEKDELIINTDNAKSTLEGVKPNRKWIGIDISEKAYYLNYYRMRNENSFGDSQIKDLINDLVFKIGDDLPKRTDITEEEQLIFDNLQLEKKTIKKEKNKRTLNQEDKKIIKELFYEEQKGMCKSCDSYLRSVDLTIDHIIPIAKNGTDNLDNLQLLCYRCNNWKRTNTMPELYKKLLDEKVISNALYVAKIKEKSQN